MSLLRLVPCSCHQRALLLTGGTAAIIGSFGADGGVFAAVCLHNLAQTGIVPTESCQISPFAAGTANTLLLQCPLCRSLEPCLGFTASPAIRALAPSTANARRPKRTDRLASNISQTQHKPPNSTISSNHGSAQALPLQVAPPRVASIRKIHTIHARSRRTRLLQQTGRGHSGAHLHLCVPARAGPEL